MSRAIQIVFCFLFTIQGYPQERRMALVVGNANYEFGYPLGNPENDANDIAMQLNSCGFRVMKYNNLGQSELRRVIDEFGISLVDADVALFFYAGHGIQVDGRNYLIPVDASLSAESDVEYNCVDAGRILSKMEDAGTKTNIVILDACRDNPFERSWRRSSGVSGLAFMDAPRGSIIAYSTAPGKTASDGNENNSPYSSALIHHLQIPNLKIEEFFKQVRSKVREMTNDAQVPWESTSLEGDFYFSLEDHYIPEETKSTITNIETNKNPEEEIDKGHSVLQDYERNRKKLSESVRSLAILPFSNYSGNEDLDYIVHGMHDALISEFGKIGAIRVISKTSTLPYADSEQTVDQIASELKVDAILETSVLRIVDGVRIHTKLINAAPEMQLWVRTFDSQMDNILNLYDQIIREIASEIQLVLTPDLQSRFENSRLVDPEAYKAYLEGDYQSEKLSEYGLELALDNFQRSIDHDSTFAPAYAGIALTYIYLLQMRQVSTAEAIPKIYINNLKALELDYNYSESQLVKALMANQGEWDWKKSDEAFRHAINSTPNHALARAFYSHLLLTQRKFSEAVDMAEKAAAIDPNNPLVLSLLGVVLLYTGDMSKAQEVALRSYDILPNSLLTKRLLDEIYFESGNFRNSIEMLQELYASEVDDFSDVMETYNLQGYEQAMKSLAIMLQAKSHIYLFTIALYYNRAGMEEEAILWLKRAYESHDPEMPYTFVTGELDNLRDDPRYLELAELMNLPY